MDRPEKYYHREYEGTTDSQIYPLYAPDPRPDPSTGPVHPSHTHYHSVTTVQSQTAHPTHQIYPPDPLYFLPPQNQYKYAEGSHSCDLSSVSSRTNLSHSYDSTGRYSDQKSGRFEQEYASLQEKGYARYHESNVIPHGYTEQQYYCHPSGQQEHLPYTGDNSTRSNQDNPSVDGQYYSSTGPLRADFTNEVGVLGTDFGNRGDVDDKTHTLQSATWGAREKQHQQADSHVYQLPDNSGYAKSKSEASRSMNVSVHEAYMEHSISSTKQNETSSIADSTAKTHGSTITTNVSIADSTAKTHGSTITTNVSISDSTAKTHGSTITTNVSISDSSGKNAHSDYETHVSKVDSTRPSIGDYETCDLFRTKVSDFVAKHSSVLDTVKEMGGEQLTIPTLHNSKDEESYKYAEPDALEFHMQVSHALREKRFFKLVGPGDVVEGHVVSKSNKELNVRITSFVGSHKLRELSDINVMGLVSFDNLSDDKKEKIWGEMRPTDVVQGVVISQQDGLLNLSFKESHVKQLCSNGKLPTGVHLGYREGKRPAGQKSVSVHSDDFLRHLESDPGFSNPSCTDNLKAILGIRGIGSEISGTGHLGPGMRPTLFKDVQMAQYPKSDYCHALRKAQRSKWSMDSVAVGVKHFKSGDYNKALKLFSHALDIDPDNVEGLVARGALYANGGKFKEGIADFEKALTVKHSHKNARNYLVETQVAYGEELERKGKMQEAMRCYKEALADDPSQTTARQRLEVLTAIMEKQVAERREKERKKEEEEKTFKKIQKLLEKERDRKSKRTSKKSKQSKKKKTKKGSKKVQRKSSTSKRKSSKKKRKGSQSHRDLSSSESDYSNESTLSDRSRSRSRSLSSSRETRHRGNRDSRQSRHSRSQSRQSRHSRSRSKDQYTSSSRHCKQSSSRSRYKSGSQSPSPHKERDKKKTCQVRSLSPQDNRRSCDNSRSRSRSPPVRNKEVKTRRYSVSRSRSRSQSRTDAAKLPRSVSHVTERNY